MAKAMKQATAMTTADHEWQEIHGWMKCGLYGCTQLMIKK